MNKRNVGRFFLAMACVAFALSALGEDKSDDLRHKLREIYEKKIAPVKLAPWEREDSVPITEKDAKSYKVVKDDGSIEFSEKTPKGDEGVGKLYVRKNPSGFAFVMTDKGRQYVWKRLYWNSQYGNWVQAHPNSSLFIKEQKAVDEFLRTLTRRFDRDASYRIPIVLRQLKNPRLKTEQRTKYLGELKELIDKVGSSWDRSGGLAAIYKIEIKIPAATPEEKVNLAMKRRKILKHIAKTIKP